MKRSFWFIPVVIFILASSLTVSFYASGMQAQNVPLSGKIVSMVYNSTISEHLISYNGQAAPAPTNYEQAGPTPGAAQTPTIALAQTPASVPAGWNRLGVG